MKVTLDKRLSSKESPQGLAAMIETLEGEIFKRENQHCSLLYASQHAEGGGYVASMPQLIMGRIKAPFTDGMWLLPIAANSEEIFGIDNHGKYAEKGQPVFIEIHGGGIFSSPMRLEQARNNGQGWKGASELYHKEFDLLLNDGVANGKKIPAFFNYNEFLELSRKPEFYYRHKNYGIIMDFYEATDRTSRMCKIDGMDFNPLMIARMGGTMLMGAYLEKMMDFYNTNIVGNWHFFRSVSDNPGIINEIGPHGGILLLGNEPNRHISNIGPFENVQFAAVSAESLKKYYKSLVDKSVKK